MEFKCTADNRSYSVLAKKEVIVCAGAYESPHLLLKVRSSNSLARSSNSLARSSNALADAEGGGVTKMAFDLSAARQVMTMLLLKIHACYCS